MVRTLATKEEWDACLDDAAAKGEAVIVDFTATWCPPCKFIAPKFEAMASEFTNAQFVKVDVE